MKVIIIEDDLEIVNSVSLIIQMMWAESKILSSSLGNEGIGLVSSEKPDVVILDIGLPDINGFEVLKQIRFFSMVPILILTARGEEKDLVKGLEMGAGEYIVKPFKQMEFLARLKLLLRKNEPSTGVLRSTIGNWQFDPYSRRLLDNDREIRLSNTEGTILSYLILNKGKVVTFSALANVIWGDDYPGCKDAIQVYISRLRQKIEIDPNQPQLILTKIGEGYFLK